MKRLLYDILNDANEGIVILDDKLEICFWNNSMEVITKVNNERAIGQNIYKLLPNLNKNYFSKAIKDVLNNDCKMFFSAAMHKGLVNDEESFNLKISDFKKGKSKFLLVEFIDVTNQFKQINILKSYIQELYAVNKQLKEKKNIIKKLAYYDRLTGVANRTLFYELAEKKLDNAKRQMQLLGVMFIDVDKFKGINDNYGHEIGDKVLANVATMLKEAVRENGIVARYGGDEFLVLLTNITEYNQYKTIVSRIFNNRNKIINCGEKEIEISLSIGISFYPKSGDDIHRLIGQADKAMYIAKNKEGHDCISCDL